MTKIDCLTDKEIIDFLESQNKLCDYCHCEENCPKNVKLYSGGCYYPPCMDYFGNSITEKIVENFRGNVEKVNLKTGELKLI